MNAYIYCRVMPNDKHAAPSDRLKTQDKRCRDFARRNDFSTLRTFSDEGDMSFYQFLPQMRLMLSLAAQQREEVAIISDHPGRLGSKPEICKRILRAIDAVGAQFVSIHESNKSLSENFVGNIHQNITNEGN